MAFPAKKRDERKEINIQQVVTFLQTAFSKATRHLSPKNTAGTDLHRYQTEFSWLLHEIQNSPKYFVAKHIQAANELIDGINEQSRSEGRDFSEYD